MKSHPTTSYTYNDVIHDKRNIKENLETAKGTGR